MAARWRCIRMQWKTHGNVSLRKGYGRMSRIKMATFALASVVASSVLYGAKTVYVNNAVGVGDDSYDGLSARYDGVHGPKFRIQAAIEVAEPGDTVMVAPGTYGDDQGVVNTGTALDFRIYIDKSITLVSSGGKDVTHIVGRRSDAEDASEHGYGAGCVSGLRIASTVATDSENPVEVKGFTFRNCYMDNGAAIGGVVGWAATSGPALKSGYGPWIVDCTISNCAYNAYGAIGRVNAVRTFIKGNYSEKAGVNAYQCNLMFCVIAGSRGQVGITGADNQYMINCTIANVSHNPCSSSCKMTLLNSVATACQGSSMTGSAVSNCVSYSIGAPTGGTLMMGGSIKGLDCRRQQLAAPLFDDFRPVVNVVGLSDKAILCGGGDACWLELIPEKYRGVDFAGNAFDSDAEGRIHIGAVQTPITPVAGFHLNDNDSYIHINGERGIGNDGFYYASFTYMDADSLLGVPYVFTAMIPDGAVVHMYEAHYKDGSVPCVARKYPWKDGGMRFVPQRNRLYEISVKLADKVYYADANNGSDEYDGCTLSVDKEHNTGPFKTLKKAVGSFASDEYGVVYVAPGTYDEGEMIQDVSALVYEKDGVEDKFPVLKSRVVVPGNVKLISLQGAESTIIKGSRGIEANGFGEGSLRCVYLQKGAFISGFTLTGGTTATNAPSATDNTAGAGIFSAEEPAYIIPLLTHMFDCVISNNVAYRGGGGAHNGINAVRCRFFDNESHSGAGGLDSCCIYECVIDRNYGYHGGANQPYLAVNCTFGADNRKRNRTAPAYALRCDPGSAVWKIFNSVFLGGEPCPVRHAYNCVVPGEGFFITSQTSSNWVDIACSQVVVDGLYTPAFTSSAVANRADMEYVSDLQLECDVYGNPRISNGGMDIGAVEADWRLRYAEIFGDGVSVTDASWNVVATDAPGVSIPAGATMTVRWPSGGRYSSAHCSIKFRVSDGATLTVIRNGIAFATYSAGLGEIRFSKPEEVELFAFSATGGSVELLDFERHVPFSIVIR